MTREVRNPVPGQDARNVGGFATPPEGSGLGVTPGLSALGDPVAVIV